MALEIIASVLLAVLVLWLLLQPLLRPGLRAPAFEEPEDPEETKRGIALIALKEIDFDLATGKLSAADHATLKVRYTEEAIAAIREDQRDAGLDQVESLVAARRQELSGSASGGAVCARCGPRPEADAVFCSSCGGALASVATCQACRTPIEPGGRFCGACGTRVAA